MKRALRKDFEPPAPVVAVEIRAPIGIDVAHIDGKIDTGADLCAIPERLVMELDLPPVRVVRAAGFGGAVQEARVYRVDLVVEGIVLSRMEAVATRRAYALIGRNVLRHLILRIDGPRETVELSLPRSR